ncbi:MAG: DUF1048 domain-containing protein [Bacilli bacterium]|jgi:DNA-binding ferritin-like protein (Dps family)|nr:DUF1048 domain-containing protein [Bacilli bacterium]
MSFLEKILGKKEDKIAFKNFKKRVKKMPTTYQDAMNNIMKYYWNGGGAMDGSFNTLYKIEELFQDGIASNKELKDVIGNDLIDFADAMIKADGGNTYQDILRNKFKKKVK